MIKVSVKHIFLYLIGIVLLVFGYPDFWDKVKEANKQKEVVKRMRKEAKEAASKPFEVQELVYDSNCDTWKNEHYYFQTIHVGPVNFKALRTIRKSTVETNDNENASDSF